MSTETKPLTGLFRTDAEILVRLKEREEGDPFGFETGYYMNALSFEAAQPFLKPETTPQQWGEVPTATSISDEAKDYMEFFESKIVNERGISVQRATMHYIAWKWLLGHEDSDTLPGSFNSTSDGGHYQIEAYHYLKAQMDNGKWDAMTKGAPA